jgi:hypothetical protein
MPTWIEMLTVCKLFLGRDLHSKSKQVKKWKLSRQSHMICLSVCLSVCLSLFFFYRDHGTCACPSSAWVIDARWDHSLPPVDSLSLSLSLSHLAKQQESKRLPDYIDTVFELCCDSFKSVTRCLRRPTVICTSASYLSLGIFANAYICVYRAFCSWLTCNCWFYLNRWYM